MRTVYEATVNSTEGGKFHQISTEFDTLDAAKAAVEAGDTGLGGKVITWVVEPNMPFCKPDMVYHSCALTTRNDGAWTDQNIHG